MSRCYVLTTEDAEAWKAVVPASACVMASVEYARICERQTGQAGRLFVAESGSGRVAYPFFLRPIESAPLAQLAPSRYDTSTPEYTGPIAIAPGTWSDVGGTAAPELFAAYCRQQGIIAEFAHLNPWRVATEFLDPACVETNREVVYIDLRWGAEGIWEKSFSSDARRQTKQAAKANVRIRRAASHDDVREFYRLYAATMDRRGALERYYFPLEYFLAFFDTMAENSFFSLAEYEGRVVAGGIYLFDDTDVYWHLSAADLDYSRVRPVNGYHWDTIQWAVRAGRRYLSCGGGYGTDDGVFRFKANFSPLRARFQVYKRIHDPQVYDSLTRAWSEQHRGMQLSGGFFPAYRASPVHPAAESEPAIVAPPASAPPTTPAAG